MAKEIEYKFLVKDESYREMAQSCHRIMQGYLCREPERTVRVRSYDERAFITIKGKNQGAERLEFEYEIPMTDFDEIIHLCEGCTLEKLRYKVRYEGFTWEVDEFHGDLAPLVMAEIELPSVDTYFAKPPFIGEDVTGDPRYYNSMLSRGSLCRKG